jgi:hypothetical protein
MEKIMNDEIIAFSFQVLSWNFLKVLKKTTETSLRTAGLRA